MYSTTHACIHAYTTLANSYFCRTIWWIWISIKMHAYTKIYTNAANLHFCRRLWFTWILRDETRSPYRRWCTRDRQSSGGCRATKLQNSTGYVCMYTYTLVFFSPVCVCLYTCTYCFFLEWVYAHTRPQASEQGSRWVSRVCVCDVYIHIYIYIHK